MSLLTKQQSDFLSQVNVGNVYAATALASQLCNSFNLVDIEPSQKQKIVDVLEKCRDVVVATGHSATLLMWLGVVIPTRFNNLISSAPVEVALLTAIEQDVKSAAFSYSNMSRGKWTLSPVIIETFLAKLFDNAENDNLGFSRIVDFVSEAIKHDEISDSLYKDAEEAILDSGNMSAIFSWDRQINNHGVIKTFLRTVGKVLTLRDGAKDVHIPVHVMKLKGTPFEKTGLNIFNGTLCMGRDSNDTLWWIDPDSFEADHVVGLKEWENFILSQCKPVNGMMPAPISVRETGEWPWEEKKMKGESKLREFVGLIIERKMREADHSSGKKVPFGSSKHIKDLEKRIKELSTWREKHKKGSEKRAHYARLISTLRQELGNARRAAEKRKK